jgi:hypothetical protein
MRNLNYRCSSILFVKCKGKVVRVHSVKACRGSGGVALFMLNLGTHRDEWSEWSASCLGHRGRSCQYPSNERHSVGYVKEFMVMGWTGDGRSYWHMAVGTYLK